MTTGDSAAAPPPRDFEVPPGRQRAALFSVFCAVALSTLSLTGLTVALPILAPDVGVPAADVVALVSWFQIAMLATLLPFAALGEHWGFRRVFLAGLGTIGLASIICASATSFDALLLGRILQGFGAAAVSAVNPAILRLSVPPSRLGATLGATAVVVAAASAAGPSLAAVVLSLGSWRWLFILNLPWVCLAMAAARAAPAGDRAAKGPFDLAGAALSIATFVLIGSSLGTIATHGIAGLLYLICGIACAAALVMQQRRKDEPLLPLDLLRLPVVRSSAAASMCAFAAQVTSIVSLPFVLHVGMALDMLTTGTIMMLWPIAVGLMAPAAARLESRIPSATLCASGGTVLAVGLVLIWMASGSMQPLAVVAATVLCGIGFGLFQTPNNRRMITATPRHRSGGAGGLQATARLLGQTFGSTAVAIVFQLHSADLERAAANGVLVAAVFAAGCAGFSLRTPPSARTPAAC